MKIKEKVLKKIEDYSEIEEEIVEAIDLTLAEVGKVIDKLRANAYFSKLAHNEFMVIDGFHIDLKQKLGIK